MPDGFRRWPWSAIAFALYPLIFIAVTNPGQVSAGSLVPTLAVAAAASATLLALLRLLFGDWPRAGLGVIWFLLLFFGYDPVNAAFDGTGGDADEGVAVVGWAARNLQLIHSIVWLLLLALGWSWLRRLKRPLGRLPAALNLVSVLLIGLALAQWLAGRDGKGGGPEPGRVQGDAVHGTPDIYFIVLDGYARADMLAQHYAWDNGPFLRRLEARGFQVADASQANYGWTFLSLASTLNMDYLPALLGDRLDPAGVGREDAYRLLRDNRAAAFLRERGYRFVHLQSTWGGTGSNPYADDFRACGGGPFRDDYLLAIAEVSWLRALGTRASVDLASCHLRNFETLAGLAREPGPKFVLVHFVPPHHPYLFDRDGNVLRNATLSNQFEFQKLLWEDRAAYIDQLVFVSRKPEEAIDRLIADSPRPPTILLVSDHGPNLRRAIRGAEYNRLRLASLSAVRLPGAPADLLTEDVSNVNLLRIVLRHLFGADLPPLPDRLFVSEYRRPFDFTEVDRDGQPVVPEARPADNM
ncbi:MAG: LTA synthase family protein [Gammaproteobacteria bacterium]|nr:LTA synthase family protein [Gammaproteobacteria bacterium]